MSDRVFNINRIPYPEGDKSKMNDTPKLTEYQININETEIPILSNNNKKTKLTPFIRFQIKIHFPCVMAAGTFDGSIFMQRCPLSIFGIEKSSRLANYIHNKQQINNIEHRKHPAELIFIANN